MSVRQPRTTIRKRTPPERPLSRGEVVTVCIAAICEAAERLVFVSDAMISSDNTSAEGARKMDLITGQGPWVAMFAGYAPAFLEMSEHVRRHLKGACGVTECSSLPLNDTTADGMIKGFECAHRVRLLKLIETNVLLNYGITREQFVQHGRQWFGDIRFAALDEEIRALDTDIDFLVAGFEPSGRPRMFSLTADGKAMRIDQLHYHAIGNGQFEALSALHPVAQFVHSKNVGEIVYRLLSAKFAAESAPRVGKDYTVAVVVSRSVGLGQHKFIGLDAIAKAKEKWRESAAAPVPADVAAILNDEIKIQQMMDDMTRKPSSGTQETPTPNA
jgi:hypothetical protein